MPPKKWKLLGWEEKNEQTRTQAKKQTRQA